MMRATFTIESPEAIECTLKITMPLSHWEDLQKQLSSNWPSSRLSSAITKLVMEAKRSYYTHDQDAL